MNVRSRERQCACEMPGVRMRCARCCASTSVEAASHRYRTIESESLRRLARERQCHDALWRHATCKQADVPVCQFKRLAGTRGRGNGFVSDSVSRHHGCHPSRNR
jgi:hypothetical protein